MLDHEIIEAVSQGLFHIYTAEHISDGIELLTGKPSGLTNATGAYPSDSVLGRAQHTLLAFHRACTASADFKSKRKHPPIH
jgi:hypothetical protein